MSKQLYNAWCDFSTVKISKICRLHVICEKDGTRPKVHPQIVQTVFSHYEDPVRLADRIKRLGYKKATKVLDKILPKTKKARSGHVGEILATEVVPVLLPNFYVPLKRLRWLDGRESALRGEDVIGIAVESSRIFFLKGESKSRAALTPAVIADARRTLSANQGRPSEHAMSFVMHRLFELNDDTTAQLFEKYLAGETIPIENLVHLLFTLSGNDGSGALKADLDGYTGKVEQHSVNMRIVDHQGFIASIYK